MKKILSTFILLFAFNGTSAASEIIQEVSVTQVQQLIASKATDFAILDANNDAARKEIGTIQGAILLTSYNQYALDELPTDKNTHLVFYCYNSYCQASHAAAERAISAGYKDAKVLKVGIVGWKKALAKKVH